VAAGAIAVLTDAAGGALAADAGVPVAIVEDPRVAMARIAADVYGRPAERTHLFGVTGTNGKTSTVFLLDAALTAVGLRVATIGTIGFRLGGAPLDAPRSTITTPESPDLQALLSVMVEGGADAVAMEVSSHALALHRVDGMVFDVAAFTMLGHDHLEFHHTLEAYFEAKARLFTGGRCRVAVINTADPWGRTLADRVRSEGVSDLVTTWVPTPTTGCSMRSLARAADRGWCWPTRRRTRLHHVHAGRLQRGQRRHGAGHGRRARRRSSPWPASGLAEAHVPGRMQRVDLGAEAPHVVVDFAHTPQAVQAALAALPATGRHHRRPGGGGRPRPLQAAADGTRCRLGRRRGGGHRRQPAQRGPCGDPGRGARRGP
jgi:UDP-N-acetylmuramoyl-L-alanyl-D-glutamate--2,6-diaminopimelate ligase